MDYECIIANDQLQRLQDELNNRLYPLCSVCFPRAEQLALFHFAFDSRGIRCGCRVVLAPSDVDRHLMTIMVRLRQYYDAVKDALQRLTKMPSACCSIVYNYV